jgi:hypothetical protein
MRVNPPVTLSNENGLSHFRPYREPYPAVSARQRLAYVPRQGILSPTSPRLLTLGERLP